FCTWTSHDNWYEIDAIATMITKLHENQVDIVYSNYQHVDSHGKVTGKTELKDLENLLFYSVIGPCFLYRKEVFFRNKGYKENVFLVEDYDFWLRASKHSTFLKLATPNLYYYRYHQESLTS